DSTFALPDFKSEERGFQLLTQVAGRAGRGEKAGRVIIQALNPEHKVIQYAKRQDFLGFYAEEIQSRKTLGFPPFSQLFRFIISAEEEIRAKQFSQAVVEHLREFLNQETILEEIPILGPATCAIPRIQGRYRYHALVKNKLGAEGHRLLTQF